jgi:hypothetical protein
MECSTDTAIFSRQIYAGREAAYYQALHAGIAHTLWSMEDIAALCEAKAPAKRGPYKKAMA